MEYYSDIHGEINGITKDSFELIKEDLEDGFELVFWKNNKIEIHSNGKHYEANMQPVYDKIAFCIDGNCVGELHEEGDELFDVSLIFFCCRQWKQVWVEVNYPENPFIESKPIEIEQE